jgi:gamma-butyrobetaine dioxygenase
MCVDPSTRQKLFQTTDIPLDIEVSAEESLADGMSRITWSKDVPGYGENHVSTYTKELLDGVGNGTLPKTVREESYKERPLVYWDKTIISEHIKFIEFDQYMSQDSVLYDVLEQLRIYGLVFLRGVPASDTAVEDIGLRIGPLRDTFYGRTWDVKSVPQAKNIAYTHQYLGLHMDLLYMDNPPHLQLLHCIKNSCEGGSSLFSDSFFAANTLWEKDLEAYKLVNHTLFHFHYKNAGQYYNQKRAVVSRLHGRIKDVAWSPPFQAPFPRRGGEAPEFLSRMAALKKFAEEIEAPENIHEYRLQEGECVIFKNRRVLHARKAFDISSGERWLKGAYLDRDVYHSKWRLLNEIHGSNGNSSDSSV